MMMIGGTGLMELLMVMLLGGGGSLPVGMPPLPDDPKMSQVAPEQALFYLSWAGTADADPKSGNGAERILADPQVKFLMKSVETAILSTINREMRGDQEATAMVKHGHLLLKQMLLRPTTLYLSKFDFGGNGKNVEAGLVVNFGKDSPAAKTALEALETVLLRELGGQVIVMDAKDGGLRQLPLPDENAPLIAWGFEGDYLMIAVGKETAGRLRGAITGGKAPAWLTEVKQKVAVKRHSSLTFLNLPAILKQVMPLFAMMTGGDEEALAGINRSLAATGLDKVKYFAATTGFDDTKFVSRSFVAVEPGTGGLFNLITSKGLTLAELADVPADADLAMVAKINPTQAWDEVMKIIAAVEPRAMEELQREMKQAEDELGFRIKEDMIDAMGDVFSIYNSPDEGGLVITGLTGVMQIKDAAKAKKVVDAMEKIFDSEWNRNRRGDPDAFRRRRYEIKTIEHGAHKIRYVNPIGDDWVVAPAWCLTGDRFVIAPYPQMVKAYLSRTAAKKPGSLAEVAEVKALFGNTGGPAVVSYMDTPGMFKKFYPLAHGFATMILGELQREGFDLDISVLPTASAILPHLSADAGSVTRTADGILSEARSSLPMAGLGTAIPLMTAGYTMQARAMHDFDHAAPSIDEAPAARVEPVAPQPAGVPVLGGTQARRTVATNELRQIGIGIFTYHLDKNASAPSLADLKPYLGKEIKTDPWGEEYVYYGKALVPGADNAAKTPFASTSHAIDGKRIVLYGDAHVEVIEEATFKKQMEAAKLPYKEPVAPKATDDGKGKGIEKGKTLEKDAPPKSSEKDAKQGRVIRRAGEAVTIEIAPIQVDATIELELVPAEK